MSRHAKRTLPLLIPTYEPGHDVLDLCDKLLEAGLRDVILTDDGSGSEYRAIFDEIQSRCHFKVLRHAVNLGKGRALKNAFNHVLNEMPDAAGVITADSDGHFIAFAIANGAWAGVWGPRPWPAAPPGARQFLARQASRVPGGNRGGVSCSNMRCCPPLD